MNNSESNQEFKVGDTVRLKSGGPLMTITIANYDGKRRFYCQWFTKDEDAARESYFPPDALQLVVKPHKKGTAKSKGNL